MRVFGTLLSVFANNSRACVTKKKKKHFDEVARGEDLYFLTSSP